jgi:hypothetical protein
MSIPAYDRSTVTPQGRRAAIVRESPGKALIHRRRRAIEALRQLRRAGRHSGHVETSDRRERT